MTLSVGLQGRKKTNSIRPLTPIECAQYIQEIKNETGESDSSISKRLQLGKPKSGAGKILQDIYVENPNDTQVKSFLRLLKISKKSVHLIGFKGDPNPVKFSTASKVANLEHDDQDIILQNVQKYKLIKDDVTAILQYQKKSNLPMLDCIEEIRKVKPEKSVQYMVAYIIPNSVNKILKTFGESTEKICSKTLEIVNKKLDGVIESIVIEGNMMVISMNEESYKSFEKEMRNKDLTYNECIEKILVGNQND